MSKDLEFRSAMIRSLPIHPVLKNCCVAIAESGGEKLQDYIERALLNDIGQNHPEMHKKFNIDAVDEEAFNLFYSGEK